MAYVVVRPDVTRDLHWHVDGDEWRYHVAGHRRMRPFLNHSDARAIDFAAGDVGYAPVTMPHHIENTGSGDLIDLEVFRSSKYGDVSLNNWLAAVPPELVEQHLGLDGRVPAAIPTANNGTV